MEPYVAPMYFSAKFRQPGGKEGKRNAAHIKYIGTRVGVQIEDQAEVTDAAYVQYIGKRPGSHGLFSSLSAGAVDMKSVQKEVAGHPGVVWRWTISLRETDARRLGLMTRESWEVVMRQAVVQAAEAMDIPESRLRWVAAVHQKKNRLGEQQPHVHVVIWEVPPVRRLGKFQRKGVKNMLVKHIYAAEADELNAVRTEARNRLRQRTKQETLAVVDMLLGQEAVSELPEEEAQELAQIVREVEQVIPKKGKVAYKLLAPERKEAILAEVDRLLSLPTWQRMVEEVKQAVYIQTSRHTQSPIEWQKRWEKSEAYRKLAPDMANRILQAALAFRKGQREAARDQEEVVIQQFRSAALAAVHGITTKEASELRSVVIGIERVIPQKGPFVFARLPPAQQQAVLDAIDHSSIAAAMRDASNWPQLRRRIARAIMWPALQLRIARMQHGGAIGQVAGEFFSAFERIKRKEMRKADDEKRRVEMEEAER